MREKNSHSFYIFGSVRFGFDGFIMHEQKHQQQHQQQQQRRRPYETIEKSFFSVCAYEVLIICLFNVKSFYSTFYDDYLLLLLLLLLFLFLSCLKIECTSVCVYFFVSRLFSIEFQKYICSSFILDKLRWFFSLSVPDVYVSLECFLFSLLSFPKNNGTFVRYRSCHTSDSVHLSKLLSFTCVCSRNPTHTAVHKSHVIRQRRRRRRRRRRNELKR